jgi:hypothetical protein
MKQFKFNHCSKTKMNNEMYMTHVGYEDSGNEAICGFFSDDSLSFIQQKVNELLKCDFPQGVIVTCPRIREVMNSIFKNYVPATGDIFSRYTIPGNFSSFNMVNDLINQTVSVIVNDVKNNIEMENNNSQLNIWNSVLGDQNSLGLRSHAPIKIRKKKPQSLMFNMKY